MDTTTSVFLTGVIVTVGRWSQGKGLTIRVVVGAVVLALFLSVLGNVDDKLGRGMALLVLLTAVLTYAIPITKKLAL